MSSLAAALAAQKPVRGATCSMKPLLADLDDIDRQALINAMNSSMAGTDISRALISQGHDISPTVIQRHRKGECHCDRG